MNGLEAIAAHNGWAIAGLGITIVFTGLTLLSLTISQLHKILALLEDPRRHLREFRGRGATGSDEFEEACIVVPAEIRESARHYKMLADRLGETFALPRLLAYAEQCGLERPYPALNKLIRSGLVIPDEDGFYRWNERVSP